MEGIGKGLGEALLFVVVAVAAIVAVISWVFWDNSEEIESKTLIVPEIRLETDGKKIDTIYVYKV